MELTGNCEQIGEFGTVHRDTIIRRVCTCGHQVKKNCGRCAYARRKRRLRQIREAAEALEAEWPLWEARRHMLQSLINNLDTRYDQYWSEAGYR